MIASELEQENANFLNSVKTNTSGSDRFFEAMLASELR
jgi:hypothetical protein